MKRELYEKCWGCDGTRKLTKPVHIDVTRKKHHNAKIGEDCPLCTDGYSAIGITVGQLEALIAKAKKYDDQNPSVTGHNSKASNDADLQQGS
jgi:hypothetical protein